MQPLSSTLLSTTSCDTVAVASTGMMNTANMSLHSDRHDNWRQWPRRFQAPRLHDRQEERLVLLPRKPGHALQISCPGASSVDDLRLRWSLRLSRRHFEGIPRAHVPPEVWDLASNLLRKIPPQHEASILISLSHLGPVYCLILQSEFPQYLKTLRGMLRVSYRFKGSIASA